MLPRSIWSDTSQHFNFRLLHPARRVFQQSTVELSLAVMRVLTGILPLGISHEQSHRLDSYLDAALWPAFCMPF